MFINLIDYIKTYFQPPLYNVYFVNTKLPLDRFERKFYDSNPEFEDNSFGYYLVKINDKELGIIQNLSTDVVEILYNITKEIMRDYDDVTYGEGAINIIDTQKNFITRYDRVKHSITFIPIVKMN